MSKFFTSIIIFWLLILNFVIIVAGIFLGEYLRGAAFIVTMAVFCLLAIALIISTLKSKTIGWQKKFFF